MRHIKAAIWSIFMAFAVAACGGIEAVPVINKSPHRVIPDAYKVKQGDSIYKIAWAFGVDYGDVAKWNGLKEPYRLSPNQVVYLKQRTSESSGLSQSAGSQPADQPESQPLVVANEIPEKPAVITPSAVVAAGKKVSFSSNPSKWNWPAEGKLTGKFNPASGNNGIQISGQSGSAVKATAAGEVVYAGEGLRGYGKLIILKHSNEFLSAYAHNESFGVREAQAVKSGEQIATMGSSGANIPMLHFEIRKAGKPVDPLRYLK